MNVLQELRKVGTALDPKFPPIPLAFSGVGQVGHIENRRGVYINSGIRNHVRALLRDHYRAERAARDLTNGRLGAGDILPIAQLGTDSRDAIRAIKSMAATITSWDGVVNARGSGKYWDYVGFKASQTTTANAWYSFARVAGNPGALTYNAIPGPAAFDAATAGAWPLPMALGATDSLYMTNFGANHATGTNIVLLVDLITAAGSISATIVTSQTVNTTALPRWTGGAGLLMALEVTTALSTATGIPNVTFNYTNQGGTAGQSTGAISIGLTSAIAAAILPGGAGGTPMIKFAAGDYGVRSIQQVTFSASSAGAGAAVAALIYKPLLMVPTLATTSFVERSTPAQIGGIRALTEVAQGSKACLQFIVLTSTTSTGNQTYLIETVYG